MKTAFIVTGTVFALALLTGCKTYDSLTPEEQAARDAHIQGVRQAIQHQQQRAFQQRQLELEEQRLFYERLRDIDQGVSMRMQPQRPSGTMYDPIYVAPAPSQPHYYITPGNPGYLP